MNIKKLFCGLCLLCTCGSVGAIPITNLVLSDPLIQVGDQFELEIWIDNDILNEEMLSFGFDVQSTSPFVSYLGFSLASEFTDVSFGLQNIAGFAFPGITETNILLATLTFNALDVGIADISALGAFDGIFSGLFYEFSGFDISAQTSVTIAPASINVPEPNTWLLSCGLILAWQLVRYRAKRS